MQLKNEFKILLADLQDQLHTLTLLDYFGMVDVTLDLMINYINNFEKLIDEELLKANSTPNVESPIFMIRIQIQP